MNRAVLALMLLGVPASAESIAPQAPPPAITIERPDAPTDGMETRRPARAAVTTLYSIGDPTDDEQLYLELVNRTRADALAEALRLANTTNPDLLSAYQFFSVDLQKFVNDTAGYPRVQPLSFEPRITQAARAHSAWMLTHGIQAHDETDPPGSGNVVNTLGNRLDTVGYPLSTAGESIFAFALNPEQGHAGFEVDWGGTPATGGMQSPPGHRINNHNAAYREVGIGVLNGTGPNGAGPQVVTIDFGSRNGLAPLVTGVAYYDLNGNQFYDKGEGIGGLMVNVSDSGFHAVTAGSGGYTVPSANGARTVTFSGTGLAPTNIAISLAGENHKVDLRLAYAPPVVTGPATPFVGRANAYTFPAVPGATDYRWQAASTTPWAPGGVEGAEQGLANVTIDISGGYGPVSSATKKSGLAGFQLAHPVAEDQYLMLNQQLRPNAGAQLKFWKRIGFASTTEVASVQVSGDDGSTWTTVWSQPGNGATSSQNIEQVFTQQTVELAPYAGKIIRVRFAYLFNGGSFFPGTTQLHGFFFDDIAFTSTDILGGITTGPITTGTTFQFTPAALGNYLLSVQPNNGARALPSGPVLAVVAVNPPANTAPILNAVSDVTIDEQVPLALTLTATDPDVPAQTLTFSLVTGPAGMTVSPAGQVSWTPSVSAGPSTNTVTARVSDGSLTDDVTFKVIVRDTVGLPVVLTRSTLTLGPSGKLRLDFALTQGSPAGFALQRSASLGSPSWQPVAGATLATNSPGNFSFRFDPAGDAGFYRVSAQ